MDQAQLQSSENDLKEAESHLKEVHIRWKSRIIDGYPEIEASERHHVNAKTVEISDSEMAKSAQGQFQSAQTPFQASRNKAKEAESFLEEAYKR